MKSQKSDAIISLEAWTKSDYNNKMHNSELFRYYGILNLLPKDLGEVLDCGCGKGYMSYLLSIKGYPVTAIDINKGSLAIFDDKCNEYRIKSEYADIFLYKPESLFEIVVNQEVLEHIDNYLEAIIKIKDLTKLNGYTLICVPYKENLKAKQTRDLLSNKLIHKNGHLHSFTPENMRKDLEKSGYRVIKIKLLSNKRLLRWIGFKLGKINLVWLLVDRLMNYLFPSKATYMVFKLKRI